MSAITITRLPWLLLVATLPGQNGGLRVRFWRQLKAAGAAILRDGVYLLPQREDLRQALEQLRAELSAAGGSAYVVQLPTQDAEVENEWVGLFDRDEAYRECCEALDELLSAWPSGRKPRRAVSCVFGTRASKRSLPSTTLRARRASRRSAQRATRKHD